MSPLFIQVPMMSLIPAAGEMVSTRDTFYRGVIVGQTQVSLLTLIMGLLIECNGPWSVCDILASLVYYPCPGTATTFKTTRNLEKISSDLIKMVVQLATPVC